MKFKKELLDELKKFNHSLETHMPNLELDFLKDLNTRPSEENEEYFALLANNLMELRTEIALTRKNLSTEIEGMLLRSISEQQNKFFEQIKKFYGVIIMELKDNFTTHLKGINEDLNGLKRKYTEISIQNENFSSLLNDILIDTKNISSDVDDSKTGIDEANQLAKRKFDSFLEELEKMRSDLNKKTNDLNGSFDKMSRKLSRVEILIDEIKLDSNIPIDEKARKKELEEMDFEEELDNKVKSKIADLSNTKASKIADINEKLERLNSLK